MNKIFKVIWSKSKQCYIVVSEVAKNHSGKKKIVVASILAAMAVGSEMSVVEVQAGALDGGQIGSYYATAIGYKANAFTDSSLAIGTYSYSKGTQVPGDAGSKVDPSIAVGNYARAVGNSALAVGMNATANNSFGVAIGRNTEVTGDYGVGIGFKSKAALHGIGIGEQARAIKEGATTLGVSSRGYGKGAIAIGWQSLAGADVYTVGVPGNDINSDSASKINDYNNWGDMSVGLRAMATGGNATALGRNAAATATNAVAIGGGNGNSFNDNTERTQATAEKATAIGYNSSASGKSSSALGTKASASAENAAAIGTSASASAKDTLAAGSSATASVAGATAVGKAAKAQKADATAVGSGATASGANATALGKDAEASEANATALGNGAIAEKADAIAIGTSATSSGGARGVAIGKGAQSKGEEATAIGADSKAEKAHDSALGTSATASGGGSTAVGYLVNATGNQSFSAGSNTKASGEAAVGIGYKASATGNRAISIGGNNGNNINQATGANSTAIGTGAQSTAGNATALGKGAIAKAGDAIAFGTDAVAGNANATALGNGANAISTSGIAIGQGATVGVAAAGSTPAVDASNSIAIGKNAKVLAGSGSIALGADTQITASDVGISSGAAQKTYPYMLTNTKGTDAVADKENGIVAIGTKRSSTDTGFARRLTGVAGGVNDYDAVNLKQVKAIESSLKSGERHIKATSYTPNGSGTITLNYVNGENKDVSETATITDVAKKSVVDGINTTVGTHTTQISNLTTAVGGKVSQSDFDAFKGKAITFTGDDNAGVARTLDTTLTVKGGANYTSTTANTNIRVEKDGSNGANGLLVKLSDKLSGMKEIAGNSSDNLVIKNGTNTVTVTPGKGNDKGTVNFGDAKVVASNLEADIAYKAGTETTKKTVKLQTGFDFVAGTGTVAPKNLPAGTASTTAATDGVAIKKGIAISTAANGVVNIGLDSDTRGAIDNAADKNLSNLSDAGKDKVKELAKTAAQDAVKVADGINTTVTTDTTTTAGTTIYKVNANDTTVAVTGDGLAITGGDLGTDKVRKYSLDLSDATKGKLTAVSGLATVIGGTTIAANGTVTGPTFSITKADGTSENATTLKDAIDKLNATNVGQNTKISETAGKVTTLEGKVTTLEGKVTDLGTTVTNNYNDLSNKIAQAGTAATTAATTKGLNFTGDDTTDTGKVHRDLGETLTIKGGANFTRGANENNIKVAKNSNDLDVKLAENLGNIKEIAGDGTNDLVIKNGDTKVTVKAPKDGNKGSIDFGDTKLVASNLDASIKYRANDEAVGNAKSVKLADGFNYVASNDATTTAEGPKSGLAITAEDNGKVTFGLDKATREKVDNAADKNLSNLSDAGKDKVKELAKDAAKTAVKVADGINTTVTTDTTTTAGTTIYKVNANDTTVAVGSDALTINNATLDTNKVRAYSVDLSDATKGKLTAVGNLATVIGGTTIATDGTVTGPTFNITKATGGTDTANTLKDAIEKLDAANQGQNTAITNLGTRITNLVDGGMTFIGDDATADKVARKLGETLNIHGQNNITVKKDGTDATTLNVKLASDLKNITSITNADADGKPGSKITLGANGVSIANTVAGADGVAGETKTVTISKDGINAGGMKVTNVAKATENGDATNKEYVDNAINNAINNSNTSVGNKGLDFYGNKDTEDTDKVHRNLGETLQVKGAENFARAEGAKNNIDVVKNTAGDGFDVKLAENLGNIKEIAGDGKTDLVIKNGDATITLKPAKPAVNDPATGDVTTPAKPATVDFGDSTVVAKNLDASIKYRANDEAVANAKSVKLADGFNYVASNDATTTAEGPKSGLAIKAEDNGKVTFGLDKATRTTLDNAASKEYVENALTNLNSTITGNANLNFAGNVTKDAQDKAAEKIGLALATGTLHVNGDNTNIVTTAKGDTITVELAQAVKEQLAKVGDTASNGRDGVNGTSGAQGLTGADGLNNATLNDKVNALRNGEAGSVVYTNDAGDRVVKAKDGKYYKADEVKADGTVKTAAENNNKEPQAVDNPQARVVNGNGDTKTATILSNIADGKVVANSKEAVNGGQLHTVKSDLATALGGDSKVNTDGSFTGPTYNITKDDGTNGTEPVKNVGDAISKLDTRINNANSTLATKGLDFYGNKDIADTDKVHRNLGEALKVKGAENFTRTGTNNIDVVKNAAGDGFDVKLAENLGNIKEIAGDGTHDLVIKNGDTKVTVKAPKDGNTGSIDFGDTKLVASNLDASIKYRANDEVVANAKSVKLADGFNYVASNDETTTTEGPKSGLVIKAEDNGKVTFGLDKATREKVDNAANKNLSNLSDDGKDKVKELAKTAAQDAVKVADGINTTVGTTTTAGVTTYKVNANDTTVAVTGDGLAITGGELGTDKVRKYSLDLSDATKGKLTAVGNLANIIGGTTIAADGTVTGPTFNITKADGTSENATTLKEAIEKLDTANKDQNTAITNLGTRITNLVDGGMTFIGDDATADKVARKLGETLNIHGQNNITVKKDGTDATTLNVKLASDLKNITSITNADADDKPGSKITIGGDSVTITNTQAPAAGATTGETKTVTIGKDGINAGNMNITNVAEAKNDGDAANKKYVDDEITKLQTTVTNNANLNFAGNVTKDAQDKAADKVGLSLATGTLHVNGDNTNIVTTAKGDTITVELAQAVKDQLAKVGDTASNGRDGKDGVSGAKGLTGADGLNNATLNDKVNALRNGEAGSVVYTNEAGDRVVKAKDGKYYKADEVKADGTVKTADENNGKAPEALDNPQVRVVNGNGDTKTPTTLSNIADGKVAANSKEAVNGGQLHTVKSDLATALGGDSKVNADGSFTGPTYNITKDDGTNTTEEAKNVGDAISKLDSRINNANSSLATKGLDFYGNKDTADTDKVHRNLGETLKVKGAENFTRTGTNNIDVVKNTAGDGFDIKLAENLANMKEVAGDGKTDLVIKNGDATITLKPAKPAVNDPATGDETTPAKPATVDFGDSNVVAKNLDASITYRANNAEDTAANTVKLKKGLNFVAGTGTVAPKNLEAGTASPSATTDSVASKKGIVISTDVDGVVNIGLDSDTRSAIDNAADKADVNAAVTNLDTRISNLVDGGMTFIGDDAMADKVARKLGETLNIHGQNNISVKKDGTDATTLNVKLASNLKNITSITNADADNKPGSKITLGADGVTITNTQAPVAGATTGETKTVTIGKDGINAGNMNITNVGEAKNDGDATNKQYVDSAINKLGETLTNNATLNFAGNVTKDAQDQDTEKVGLSLAKGTLHVNGDNTNIVTTAKGDTITVELAQAVKDQLAKVGDTASNGRDGKDGVSGAKGLTGADGLNNATLNDKVNALRNGEAGSVVYTNEAGDRVVKAKDGKYYKADEVKADGTVKTAAENNNKEPQAVDNPQARVVNGNGDTKTATTLSNIADGKVAANSKEAVNGGQLHTVKSDLATALGGDSKVNADGSFTGPTYNITKDDGSNTTEEAKNIGDAISKLDSRINNANSSLATKGLDFYGNKDTADTDKVHRNLGETLKVKGAENFKREATATNNIDVVKNTAGDGFDVKLAENLANMKEIAGDGKTDLVIKNGDATITLKPAKPAVNDPATGDETTQAKPATVDFGDSNVVAKNLDASIKYRANNAEKANANSVKLADGFNFVAGTGTVAPKAQAADGTNPTGGATTATSPTAATDSVATKKGIAISTDVDGVVNIGLDSDTRSAIDNAANQDLSNLTPAGKKAITDAAQGAVKVAAGNNVTVDTETKDNVTTYTVNGRDTMVKAATGGSVSVTGGNLNAKGEREYTVDLTDTAKAEINRIAGIDTRLTAAEGNITTLQGDMTKAKADIVTNAGNIAKNAGDIATNKANIAKNAGDIATNADNIKTNATNIGKNTQAIQALQGNSATKDLSNLTNVGKDVVTGLVNVVGTNGITVTNATDDTSRVKTFTAKLDDKVTFGKDGNKITIDGTTGMITAPNATINVVNTNTIQAGDANTTNTAVTPEGVTVTTKQPDGTITSTVMIKDGTVSGLTNTKWDPTKVTDTDRSKAATQGQVKDVSDTLQKGRVFAADTGVGSTTVALGDTLAIKGGAAGALTDHNIGVELSAANGKTPATMTVRLAKNVQMKDGSTSYNYYLPEIITKPDGTKDIAKNADGTVKYQTDKEGNPISIVTTTVNGEGITITPVKGLNKPSVSLTADGLDNGGNAIHHVGPGTAADDAATLGQVVAAASAVSRQVNQTGAHAAALAAMNPLSYDPLKKSQVMAGYGAYKGNSALALGVAHYANEDTLFNVGVSVGNGENMVNAGMTYRFGGEDSMIPERYKGGPISSVYVMQDEITALKAENARKDAENAKKDAENEEMKAQIKMLIERVTMLEAKK